MGKYIVYKITNKANGKMYIGYTSQSLSARWSQHCHNAKRGKSFFGNAINKHGKDQFDKEIIEVLTTHEGAKIAERLWIKELKTWVYDPDCNGYNLTVGGEGAAGWVLTPETSKKMSEAHKGLRHTEETKDKMSKAAMGKPKSDEMKRKLSAAKKGKKLSEEHKRKIGLGSVGNKSNTGRKLSEEHKANISKGLKNRKAA